MELTLFVFCFFVGMTSLCDWLLSKRPGHADLIAPLKSLQGWIGVVSLVGGMGLFLNLLFRAKLSFAAGGLSIVIWIGMLLLALMLMGNALLLVLPLVRLLGVSAVQQPTASPVQNTASIQSIFAIALMGLGFVVFVLQLIWYIA